MVADCQLVRSSADAIQEKAKEFTTVAWSVRNIHLNHSYVLCYDATVEVVLVSKFGLEGLIICTH